MGDERYLYRIDDLGRIVIPKDFRKFLKLGEFDEMEAKLDINKEEIIFSLHKKHTEE